VNRPVARLVALPVVSVVGLVVGLGELQPEQGPSWDRDWSNFQLRPIQNPHEHLAEQGSPLQRLRDPGFVEDLWPMSERKKKKKKRRVPIGARTE
jgi:hypothetical protein